MTAGTPLAEPAGLRRYNALPTAVAEALLTTCCTASAWASAVVARRPVLSLDALITVSSATLRALDDAGLAEALAGHARIGAPAGGAGRREQAGVTDADRATLSAGNQAYEQRFGRIYLVRAAGRSGAELIELLHERLAADPVTEDAVVRRELADITARRLQDLRVP